MDGGSVLAGKRGSYGNSAWEGDTTVALNGKSWNLGSLMGGFEGKADKSVTDNINESHMTIEKASLNLSIDPNGGTWNGSSSITEKVGITGYTETISNPTRPGYKFDGWTVTGTGSSINGDKFTMGSQDATLKANWTASTTKYRVRHWQQNVDGNASLENASNYTLESIEEKSLGLNSSSIKPPVKIYEGFISPAEKTVTVSSNGDTVVDYYYKRKSYNLTLNVGTGISGVTGGGTHLYGKLVTINANVSTGFRWSNWTGTGTVASKTYSFNMPAKDVVYTANAVPDEYIITYELNGGTVVGNPNKFTADTTSFTLVNPTKQGYTFAGWTGSNGTTPTYTVTIAKGSTGNRNYIANWTPNKNIPYKVRHWTQKL